MAFVSAVILHRPAAGSAGPLERTLADARRALGEELASHLRAAGAAESRIVAEPPDDTPFGARLRAIVADGIAPGHGLVVAGAGSAALARVVDVRPFVATAATGEARARTNNRYSADVVALGDPSVLRSVPDLPSDNALPRWLAEVAGIAVDDEARRWRLQVDVDSPLDVLLLRGPAGTPDADTVGVRDRLSTVAAVLGDRRAEVLVAGRTSATSLRWLERRTAARIRAFVEERGLRASSPVALGDAGTATPAIRPPRSLLGTLLDANGPRALGTTLAGLADAALVDSRVLLAHRLGADERRWPSAEDRFASDLLLAERIADPWLRELTQAAHDAPIPIVLGGHTLVGPGVRLVAAFRAR
jgi:hypothetical protein